MKPNIFAICFFSTIANLTFADQELTPAELGKRTQERRAVEAVIWGMPAVNFDRLLQAAISNGAEPNQIMYWSRPLNWKNQTLTPNPDTIYFNPFYDTTSGPIVLEIPPAQGDSSITGSIDDAWQNALEDVGPAGADKGNGGKYLITPPGYKEQAPGGYTVLPSDTYRGFAILRSNFKSGSDADIAAAVEYGKRIKIYPLSEPGKATVYVDMYDKLFDATIPYDDRFFESLNRFVQIEPWLTRDKAMIDTLKSVGIEKGAAFSPNEETKTALKTGALEGHDYLEARYISFFNPPFYSGTHWNLPASKELAAGMPNAFTEDPNSYPVDDRGAVYSVAYFSAKHLGTGQFYLMTLQDKSGKPFDGKRAYRLTIPANAPVKLYWSATAYDRETHALIRNTQRSSRASNSAGIQPNQDGSVDIIFSETAPAGKENNWIPTSGRNFEVLFRFYGPEKPFFDKTWKLPDIEMAADKQSTALQSEATPVTADNFARAESDLYFGAVVKRDGFGKFEFNRAPTPIDKQTVIRMNRDTIYGGAVFDLGAGPVTVTLPDSGKRFMSMQVINEDHYSQFVAYKPGAYTFSEKEIGTRYVIMAVRILVDPTSHEDLEEVRALQDAIKVEQPSVGTFAVPSWEPASQKAVRDALLALAKTLPDTMRMFGTKDEVDPIRHLIGSASAWGGNPEKDALYLNVTPIKNDGTTPYQLTVKDVPVDGFWSISVYNANGYFEPNSYGAYSLNNITAKKNDDGSVVVHFGGNDPGVPNYLPIVPGWNYMVRLYRPKQEVLNGTWTFPEAQPVQ
jgi:hypothetical protein